MARPQALVLRSTGTNCEVETALALELGGAEASILHFDRVLEDPARLAGYRILAFAGGFSFGDDLSAGRVWGAQLRGPLREALNEHVNGGGFALGICNGFQVLVESGIFEPEAQPDERSVALYANASNKYECRWVNLEVQESRVPWLPAGERFPTPVAHAEGRFVAKDLEALRAAGQIALTYVTESGDEPAYPDNPNGAMGHVAGICDPTGRVLGLMPHPERNLFPWNHPHATRRGDRDEGEGALFYRRLVETAGA